MKKAPPALPYLAPPETAILTAEQLAAWFQKSVRQIERLDWIPWMPVGSRSKRVLVRDVLAELEARRRNGKETPA